MNELAQRGLNGTAGAPDQAYLDNQLRSQPFEATQLGDRRFDSLLNELFREATETGCVRAREAHDLLPRQRDLGRCHEVVLADGPVPVKHLPELVT